MKNLIDIQLPNNESLTLVDFKYKEFNGIILAFKSSKCVGYILRDELANYWIFSNKLYIQNGVYTEEENLDDLVTGLLVDETIDSLKLFKFDEI